MLRMHPISTFREMLSGLSHWVHPPAAGPQAGPTVKSMLTRNPNSTFVQVKLLLYVVYSCPWFASPRELRDGPINLHRYPSPSSVSRPSPHQDVLENWWEDFFHEQECTWFKGYFRKRVGCRQLDTEPP